MNRNGRALNAIRKSLNGLASNGCNVRLLRLLGLVSAIWFGGVRLLFAHTYQVGGYFNHTNFTESGGVDSILNYTFSVQVETNKVVVSVATGGGISTSWSFDGTNSYYLIDSTNVVAKIGRLNAAVTLHEKEFPYSSSPVERSIWLGLASGHFLNQTKEELLLVPWLDWAFPGTLSFDWQILRSEQAPFLPVQISFVASKRLWEREQAIKIGKLGEWPHVDGETGGLFKVSGFLTNGGLVLPSAFQTVRYFDRASRANHVLAISSIQVTNFIISSAATTAFVPQIVRATDVSDMRSESADMPRFGITYTLTNDSWLGKMDPVRLAMIESNKPVYAEWRRALAAKARGGNPSGTCSKRPFTQKDCANYDEKTCKPVAKTYTGPQVNGTCYWTGSGYGCQF